MTAICERLCAASPSERDVICAAEFGKTFAEAVADLVFDDVREGVESGEYVILSASVEKYLPGAVSGGNVCEVFFAVPSQRDLMALHMMCELYRMEPPYFTFVGDCRLSNVRFQATLYGDSASAWAMSQVSRLQRQCQL